MTDTAFKWTKQRERAAYLVAEDRLSDERIAQEVRVSRMTLHNWKSAPEFAARVRKLVEAFRDRVRQRGIAIAENRVDALQDRWDRMKQVIEERAADPKMLGVPGGGTGLIVHTVKGIGTGESFRMVDLYEVDAGLLSEMRNHERQAAQELGQWTDRKDVTSAGKRLNTLALDDLTDEELDQRLAEAEGRKTPAAVPE